MTFTPGPWDAVANSEGSWSVCNLGGTVIARVYDCAHEFASEDALLIAAAPEMLEALQRIADFCHSETRQKLLGIAETALRKVRGGGS